MAATPVFIPVEEYLHAAYRPDCDYIDGEVLERNMGETPHARLQSFFLRYFSPLEDEHGFETLPEQRFQVGPENYRVPDIMLVALPNSDLLIVERPPLLCIDILSRDDRMPKIQERLDDYAAVGVRSMWIVDPWRRVAYLAGRDAVRHEVADRLTVEGTSISISVPEIFGELDRLETRAAGR